MKNEVTPDMLRRLVEELRPSTPTSAKQIHHQSSPTTPETAYEVSKLQSALAVLSPDAARGQGRLFEPGDSGTSPDNWLLVVWAIASLRWTCGEGIARAWSKQSARYTDEGFDDAWNSYNASRPDAIGAGSLYKLAISHGWQPPAAIPVELAPDDRRYRLLSPADVMSLPHLEWRLKHIFPAAGLAAIYGPSGSGKSFLACDLAAAIASGREWFGVKTYPAPVVYVMLEGEGGIRNRVVALEKAHGALPDTFKVVIQPFQFTEAQDVTDLASVIPSGAVVFVDTLNRAAPTSDENSSKEMGVILQAAKDLQGMTAGLVVVVHHTGKDSAKGMRGHSSLYAALDGAIEVERSMVSRSWSVAKTKDGSEGNRRNFKLEVQIVGRDADGEDITSCSVAPDSASLFVNPEPKGAAQKSALKAIKMTLSQQASRGIAGCPAGSACMKVDGAIATVASGLTTTKPNKRTHEAKRLVTALIAAGFLGSGIDSGEEAWCWLV